MDNLKENLTLYLPAVEEFLTSLLLEETDIEITSIERVENDSALSELNESDIFLYASELKSDTDIIVVLDEEWFGLLSSIMLGIEEKEKNETTIGLLQEFSSDLSDIIIERAKEEEDKEFEFDDVQVLDKDEVREQLSHEEYFWSLLEIAGIADDKVRAGFLMGDPDMKIVAEEEPEADGAENEEVEEEAFEEDEEESTEDEFSALNRNQDDKNGRTEEVISARHIEFAEFTEDDKNGNGKTHSMDLLKDVELDVSVELGRIELPLGKVLQLAKGSVIELEKLAGEPVDILVNGNRIALGEVVVIDEHFGVRISSLVTTKKRLAKINGS